MAEIRERQLAAIMFTDMVGYTALMQHDEKLAMLNRNRHRKVLQQYVNGHNGKILQYYGDGTLSIFNSAIEAVNAAVEIQRELQKEPKVPLRIGVHTGDVVFDEEGVYGDGVNIASRIESFAVPGAVLISEKVYDDIKNHPELPVRSMGRYELKNVNRPVEVFAVANEGLVIPEDEYIKGKGKPETKSIAVLPFVNMSNDPENEYFSDGITEELLNALTKVEGLRVISRTSSFAFKGKNEDVRKIGKQLEVSTILEGSVRKSGNRVRITAQLINAMDGYHIWSEVYDSLIEDIFDVQDKISKRITNSLREKLAGSQMNEPIVKSPTNNVEAYNLYLKGLYFKNKFTPKTTLTAIQYFNRALLIEPGFALLLARLSECYILLGTTGFEQPRKSFDKAKETALKALQIDKDLLEAQLSLAAIKIFYDWDIDSAFTLIKKAIQQNPGAARVHMIYCLYYLVIAKLEESLVEIKIAERLDPLSVEIKRTMADVLYFAGYYDEAIKYYDQALDLDPAYITALEFKGWAYLMKGKYGIAIDIFKNMGKSTNHALKGVTQIGYSYARAGDRQKAKEYLEQLKKGTELKQEGAPTDLDFAIIYTGLKDFDRAFHHLEKCVEYRLGTVIFLIISPVWIPLRDDVRFQQLTLKIWGKPVETSKSH